ncbi:MAG: F0F1 ATP synthase subunit A [Acetobacteraceae bacterium]|nr:F0F1 ATP synthase subunit A [Acetobacteraceae bacterium]
MDILGQFTLKPVLGSIGAGLQFTQSNAMMVAAGAVTLGLLYFGMRPRALVPGRLQAAAEVSYNFIHDMCVEQVGEEGKRFFPFVFTVFFFVLMGNLLGLIPGMFTFTSHIAVTFGLALIVWALTTVVALKIHGLHFFSYFFPAGVPIVLAPLIVVIEVISYLSRPISLAVRLFVNMVVGHVMFELFASFIVMLALGGALGIVGGVIALGPLAINVALVGFELLVCFLQAYVFAILTCIYLHDAVHLH